MKVPGACEMMALQCLETGRAGDQCRRRLRAQRRKSRIVRAQYRADWRRSDEIVRPGQDRTSDPSATRTLRKLRLCALSAASWSAAGEISIPVMAQRGRS